MISKLQQNGQQTVRPQPIVHRPPAMAFSLAIMQSSGQIKVQGNQNGK
jgi:hypothetical protein